MPLHACGGEAKNCVGPLYHVGPESGLVVGATHTEIPLQPLIRNFKKVSVSYSVLLTA